MAEEMYQLSAVVEKNKVTLSKTTSQEKDLRGKRFKDFKVTKEYKEYDQDKKTKAILIRVTIPEGGNLYGYDIIIPEGGEIDEDKTELDVGSDTIKVKIKKKNDFDLERANRRM